MKKSLSSLNFIIRADIDEFQTGLKKAVTQLNSAGQQMKSIGTGMTKYVTAPLAALATGMAIMANASAENAEAIEEMSIKTGLARSTLQELSFVGNQAGIEMNTLQGGVARLYRAMGDAADGTKAQVEAFSQLGVKVTDSEGRLRSMSDVFPEVIGALGRMDNETERNALSFDLFGRGANELVPILADLGEEGIKSLSQKAHDLGLVLSDEGIKSLDEYKDSMDSLKLQFQAIRNEMSVSFVNFMKSSVIPILQDKVVPAVRRFGEALSNMSPAGQKFLAVTGLIVAGVGPMIAALGILASSVIPAVIRGVKMISVAFTQLFTLIMAHPIMALITVLGVAIGALLLFRKRTDDAAEAQHKLGTAIEGVNTAIGKQIWEQLVASYEKAEDGSIRLVGSMDNLRDSIGKMSKGELESLRAYLQERYTAAAADATGATGELNKQIAEQDMKQFSEAIDMINGRLKDYKEYADGAAVATQTLEEEITALEAQLWKEILAQDSNMTSTARLLREKQSLLNVYKSMKDVLLDVSSLQSIAPKDQRTQISVEASKPKQLDFRKETEGISAFTDKYEKMGGTVIDVNNVVMSSAAGLTDVFGDTIENLVAGTASFEDMFTGLLDVVSQFLKSFGEALVAAAIGGIAFQQLALNPYAALAAGVALIALAGAVKGVLKQGLSGGEHPNAPYPGMASGGIVTRPTLTWIGERTPEAVIPLNRMPSLLPSMQMSRIPVSLNVTVEGMLKGQDIYLSNKKYNSKMSDIR